MHIRRLESKDEPLMLELMRSENSSPDTDYYLDRGNTFWGLYDWYSKGNHYAHGVFDGSKLIGMVAVVSLPFCLKGTPSPIYMVTDMLIDSSYRKSFAAARLLTALHTDLPGQDFIIIWIENRVGFAEAVPKISKRFGRSTEFPRETKLITLYPNQNSVDDSTLLKLETTDNPDEIEAHLKSYQAYSHSWIDWQSKKIEIANVFKRALLFRWSTATDQLSGLILDRGNLQMICWNGRTKLLIEKYRRSLVSKNRKLSEGDELPFANVCFVIGSSPSLKISKNMIAAFNQWGFENTYFGINFRDLEIENSGHVDRADFTRRVFLSSDKNEAELSRIVEGLNRSGVALESIYL